MRTTLDIDNDLLIAVKEIARRESKTTGAVVSGLLRKSLAGVEPDAPESQAMESLAVFGFRPFPKRGGVVTNEQIDRVREEAGDLCERCWM